MSVGIDKVRYGRLCLLMLHTCPLRLRCIIDNSYCREMPNFETFLNNNLHQLFHLRYRNCCCGNTSNNSHISKSQWDLLYSQISTRNPHGRRGECPCQYKAKIGVTSDVLGHYVLLSLPHQLLLWCFTDRCGHHSTSLEWPYPCQYSYH